LKHGRQRMKKGDSKALASKICTTDVSRFNMKGNIVRTPATAAKKPHQGPPKEFAHF